MKLACVVYFAQLNEETNQLSLQELKDNLTRRRASDRVTGIMMIAGGYLFEIMEGDYTTLELELDHIQSCEVSNEPEVLIFAMLNKKQFDSWRMGVIEHANSSAPDLSSLRFLCAQSEPDPISTQRTVLTLLQQFHSQFATPSLESNPSADRTEDETNEAA
ncbi:MAG: BLUF domain-containing protein [Phycisphaerales bacterium]|nr:BLUF domain-containing protein [Phycisphaerales bacterium]